MMVHSLINRYQVNDPSSLSNFGHAETRRGDTVTGSYFVALPDGRLQTVVYTVDKVNGYRARVSGIEVMCTTIHT